MNKQKGPDRKTPASEADQRKQHWIDTRETLKRAPLLIETLQYVVTGTNETGSLLTPEQVAHILAKELDLLKAARGFLSPGGEGYTINAEATGAYKEVLSPLVLKYSGKK